MDGAQSAGAASVYRPIRRMAADTTIQTAQMVIEISNNSIGPMKPLTREASD
jgi:hypothetical protein